MWAGLIVLGFVVATLGPSLSGLAAAGLHPNQNKVKPGVFILTFNPVIEAQGSRKLVDLMGWNDPNALNPQYEAALRDLSGGYVDYSIKIEMEVDGYPAKDNGHIFSDDEYMECLTANPGPNCSLMIDYPKLLTDFGICELVNKKRISELWLWGGPWFGFWEAVQAGPNPIFTNAPPILGTSCDRTLDIMGFSYERGLSEMIHDFGHRVEGNMDHVYSSRSADESTPWNRFTLHDFEIPGRGGCGTVHHPVNNPAGPINDYANLTIVPSSCNDFLNYPNLSGVFRDINCEAWACTELGYLQWWLGHLPRSDGLTDGKLNNWWGYVVRR